MPTFLGVLTLDEQKNVTIEEQGAALLAKHTNGTNGTAEDLLPIAKHSIPELVVPIKNGKRIATNQAVVLENAGAGFVKPNILDVKLGVRLWADDAAQEKKTRFDKVTQETTHKDLGFRIAGMRVWQGHNAQGKDIDADGYKIYDKNYGRFSIKTANVDEAFKNFIFTESAGIDEELGQLICQAFLADVTRIKEVMEAQESRMFSASLLFVFEGDGVALRAAMEEASAPRNRCGDEEDDDDDNDEAVSPKIYAVKVIDFAHAQWVPGQGPDENSLVGIRSVADILARIGGV
jgi:1D-myo-inositol-tetrakisphosphate 5-kinase/inositol-polyphosphate multikinase